MKEKTVRKIMKKYYFETKHIEVIPNPEHAPGPDFFCDGKALEIKGSDAKKASEFNRAISQFIKYVFRYSDLEIALPIDVLNARNLVKLDLLSRIIWKVRQKKIKTYLIANYKHQYFVKEFDDCKDIISGVLNSLPEWCITSRLKHETIENVMNRIEKVVTRRVNMAIGETLREIILTKADMALEISDL